MVAVLLRDFFSRNFEATGTGADRCLAIVDVGLGIALPISPLLLFALGASCCCCEEEDNLCYEEDDNRI